jgi:hypothetical protein
MVTARQPSMPTTPAGTGTASSVKTRRGQRGCQVRVLSRFFRRRCLEALYLNFLGDLGNLPDHAALAAFLAPLHSAGWVVYAKPPFPPASTFQSP